MTPLLIGSSAVLALMVLLVLGLPVAFSLGLVGAAGLFLQGGLPLVSGFLSTEPYSNVASFTLVVIPMFVLMGELAVAAGMAQQAYAAARAWFGRLPGGLMMAAIGASTIFAAVSGSSVAATTTIGRVSIAEMRRYGYEGGMAAGAVAVAGTLSALIPPSAILVFYALITDQSISRMLMAGIGPGLLSATLFITVAYLMARWFPQLSPVMKERVSWRQRLSTLSLTAPFGLLVLVVLGGIYSGLVTVTEAAALGALAALGLLAASRRLSWPNLRQALDQTARISCMIFLIIIGGVIFSRFLAFSGIPFALVDFIHSLQVAPLVVVIVMLLILTGLGMFIDPVGMIMLTLPFFYPIIKDLGLDPVWFGVLIVLQAELGVITPPIGIHLFVVKQIAPDVPLGAIIRGVVPFMLCQFAVVALVVAFPEIALWLPGQMR
ncbi:MAG TPA: TRAP transporter large permease [Alphaproteobacteria bacterium]|nr:TRAP transporter large permease [Alphaproteobacteria bacterium]HJM50092.1 TRAP transporter large permease [Alphaproteobacteria bacterium]